MITRAHQLSRLVPWLHGRGVLLVVAMTLVWLGTSHARAHDALVLTLDSGSTCLQKTSLEHSLSSLLSNAQQAVDLTVHVLGSVHDPRTAVITLKRDEQAVAQRTFSPGPPRCDDFHNAVALAISLMLKSLEESEPASAAPSPPPRNDPPAELPPPVATPAPLARPRARLSLVSPPAPARAARVEPVQLSALGSGVLARHVGARTAWGARLELALTRSHYGLRVGVLGLYSRPDMLAETRVDYRTRPLAATLAACVGSRAEATPGLRGCLGLLAGRIQNHGLAARGVEAHSEPLPWFALTATLELSLRLYDTLRLLLSLAPSYTTRELRVFAEAAGDPSEALPRLGALFTIGLGYDFYRQGSRGGRHE